MIRTTEPLCMKGVSLAGRPAVGPYSDVVSVGGLLFLSGRIGLDPGTGALVRGGVSEQTRQSLANVAEVLALAGATLSDVVKATVFLTDMADFAALNGVYGDVFGEHRPARTTVAVAQLPLGALVEIETIALAR